MDLSKLTGFYKELQNPKELKMVFPGPKVSFWGIDSGTSYRVNFGDVIEVDERDYDYLLTIQKRGIFYFEELEHEIEVFDVVDHQDHFDVLVGIGKSLNEKLHSLEIHTLEELYSKGEEWISELPKVSKIKANKIYTQLEELIGA